MLTFYKQKYMITYAQQSYKRKDFFTWIYPVTVGYTGYSCMENNNTSWKPLHIFITFGQQQNETNLMRSPGEKYKIYIESKTAKTMQIR